MCVCMHLKYEHTLTYNRIHREISRKMLAWILHSAIIITASTMLILLTALVKYQLTRSNHNALGLEGAQ